MKLPKGRQMTQVNKDLLVKCIKEVEDKGPLVNRTALYQAAANLYNTLDGIPSSITASVAYSRIREWKIEVATPLGKRGNPNLRGPINKGEKKNRQEKTEKFKDNFDLMRKEVIDHGKEALLPLIDKIEKGSIQARIKFNCIRCCGYDRAEIARCTSYACPWFSVRPNAVTREEQENIYN